ncbi:MAG: tRNA pseudouridine(13) synthase TruD [Candidatus Hodarchaeota archaeon]
MDPPKLDKSLGMEFYGTSSPGLGGIIRKYPIDFIVKEVIRWYGTSPLSLNKNYKTPHYGPHLLAALVKERWDNIIALSEVQKRLNLHKKDVYIPGIKDARALTSQFLWIRRAHLTRLLSFNVAGIKLYPISYVSFQLDSSHLIGNSFDITIRKLECNPSTVNIQIAQTVNEASSLGGIPNFFGHQRFGSLRPISHLIGKQIIQRDFKAAVMTYLTFPSRFENNEVSNLRKIIQEREDFNYAYKKMPRKYLFERILLKSLKNELNYVNALKKLPLRLKRIFVNAYQSYLFNKTVSKRIKSGLLLNKAELRDFVLLKISSRTGLEPIKVETHNISRLNRRIAEGKASLVIPLFGYKTIHSGGSQELIEKEVLKEENLSLRLFYVSPLPEVSCEGDLRTIVLDMKDFRFNVQKEKINVRFFLNKAGYATTLLRELMKPKDYVKAGF